MVAIDELKIRYPGAVTFRFGDNAELCDRLLDLVRSGQKTASAGALRTFESGEPLPVVGRRDIALTWDGRPALVIETREVLLCRFIDVTEKMALAEGENEDLAGWQADHRTYFARNGGFDPEMPVVWERFTLVEDLLA